MKAQEIMTRDVVSVLPNTKVREIATLMSERHVSGVPVVAADGQLLGVVSQSDLLHRAELGTERKRKAWLSLFADPDVMAREYSKSHGIEAHDVMSRPVVSVTADADLQEVADVLERHRIKRVAVLDGGKLVGIISRGDLVRALSTLQTVKADRVLADGALQEALMAKIRQQSWLDTSYTTLTVKNGLVELWGMVKSDDQRNALHVLIEETEGVKSVSDHTRVGSPRFAGI